MQGDVENSSIQSLYESIFSASSDGILIVRREDSDTFRYSRANTAIAEIIGIRREEILGSRPEDLFDEEVASGLKQLYRDVIESGESKRITHQNTTPRGQIYTRSQIDPIELSGGAEAVLVVANDVTDLMRTSDKLKKDRKAFRDLYEVAGYSDKPLEEQLTELLKIGAKRLKLPLGFVTLIQDGTQVIIQSVGEHAELQPESEGPVEESYCRRTLANDDKMLSLMDAESEGWADDPAFEVFGLRCYIGTALEYYGGAEGTVCFADTESRDLDFDESERTFVRLLGQWISARLEQAQLMEDLLEESRTDSLTGLPSHEELFRRLEIETERAKRYGTVFSYLMIDLDHFHQINSNYGHRTGDEVLRKVATILEDEIREVDTAGRYGGEEFGVILPETNLDGATQTADRIRKRFSESQFESTGGEVFEVTCSIGVAQHRETDENADNMAERADRKLYMAKAEGRDRVVSRKLENESET